MPAINTPTETDANVLLLPKNSEYVTPGLPLLIHSCAAARTMWTCSPPHLCPSMPPPSAPSSMLACHHIFPAFQKPTHPKGKATHTHWARNPPQQNAWTGWHDPTYYTSHPSPTFPVLLITHTTTHGDTCAGAGLRARENGRLLSVGQVSAELEPWSLSATRHNSVFPPSSPVSSRQNLCQGVDCFVALTVFQAGRNNEASANSRPLTIIPNLWWRHVGFKFISTTSFQHTSGAENTIIYICFNGVGCLWNTIKPIKIWTHSFWKEVAERDMLQWLGTVITGWNGSSSPPQFSFENVADLWPPGCFVCQIHQ